MGRKRRSTNDECNERRGKNSILTKSKSPFGGSDLPMILFILLMFKMFPFQCTLPPSPKDVPSSRSTPGSSPDPRLTLPRRGHHQTHKLRRHQKVRPSKGKYSVTVTKGRDDYVLELACASLSIISRRSPRAIDIITWTSTSQTSRTTTPKSAAGIPLLLRLRHIWRGEMRTKGKDQPSPMVRTSFVFERGSMKMNRFLFLETRRLLQEVENLKARAKAENKGDEINFEITVSIHNLHFRFVLAYRSQTAAYEASASASEATKKQPAATFDAPKIEKENFVLSSPLTSTTLDDVSQIPPSWSSSAADGSNRKEPTQGPKKRKKKKRTIVDHISSISAKEPGLRDLKTM